jgi:hypothetical protein
MNTDKCKRYLVFPRRRPRYLLLPSVTPEVKEINEEFNVKIFDVIDCNKFRISEMYQAEIFV